ncbi:MAG: hypothetical protein JW891_12135 [Candidatus Lokiarchaeota archaeon]|nr:hypothetical protein [Candidatus Lokiarchaeota archaeon]
MVEENIIEISAAPNNRPLNYRRLNEEVHEAIKSNPKKIVINDACGQRFIAASLQGDLELVINGLPGNDLGIFMDGPKIVVHGNCEDQAGNTMNDGEIIVHGEGGDVIGLSARGGKIYVKKDVGYRVGIHIKEYEHKFPVIVIGGTAKDFLGEYMAGGLIVALGLKFENGNVVENDHPICGSELGTGIHRGKIVLRTDEALEDRLGIGAKIFDITEQERAEITPFIDEFCEIFNIPKEIVYNKPFKVIKPISKRPFGGNYCGQIV